jgi:uncharacterized protein
MAATLPDVASPRMEEPPRFLCDEMLMGLGRWLRLAGYDTAIAGRGRRDRDLVEQARAEGRMLLTRDRRMVDIRGADERTIVLAGEGIDASARELARHLPLDWTLAPLSRCARCNARLERAGRQLVASLPSRIHQAGSPVTVCPRCGRLYWEGSHVGRIRERLAAFARPADDDAPP